jgi:hypothetical protein
MKNSLAFCVLGSLLLLAPAGTFGGRQGPTVKVAGLVGHWPLQGDCRDHSGNGNHGKNHGVDLANGTFNGRDAWIEVPYSRSLDFGAGDFTISAWVWTEQDSNDVIGDVVSKFDPVNRKGLTLAIKASAGGYNGPGNDRHVYFGIDNGKTGGWEDCGRPNPTSNYVSNSLTVFDGHLYAATTDAAKEEDWCHVYRYRGKQEWEDCGRVGKLRTRGVGPLIVHNGQLYAATWSYDWTRVAKDQLDLCRVYRYAGSKEWIDCGQPGASRRLFGIASYKGNLYVVGDDRKCYRHDGGPKWEECGKFPNYGHPMGVHDGRLFVGVLNPAGIWAYDGAAWKELGNPYEDQKRCNQIHAFDVYRGRLHATTWPEGRVARLSPEEKWVDCGRLGDCLEINGLTVYNGKLYGGTIPRAEVFRYESGQDWTSLKVFHEPADRTFQDSKDWARVTSLTVYAGKLFASMGSCTSAALDAPCDFRGKVYALEAGKCISYDRDLGTGWKHLAAVRRGDRVELYINGKLEAASGAFAGADYDLSSNEPWKIGFGEMDYFTGKIREVRAYNRAIPAADIAKVVRDGVPKPKPSGDHPGH